MALPFSLEPVTIICGHYGVGKTNFALNVALDAAESGYEVVLVDLDIVNPYFRSSEYRDQLETAGVELVSPVFAQAGTSLDVPSLTGAIVPALNRAYFDAKKGDGAIKVIVDVGGDDAGATALSRFSKDIAKGPYAFLYVVNRFRNLTQDAQEAIAILREIEERCSLSATGIVGNSHLKADTDAIVVAQGLEFAQQICEHLNLQLMCVTAPISLVQQESAGELLSIMGDKLYPVRLCVKSPWE